MRSAVFASVAAFALVGCASTTTTRAVQSHRTAPAHKVLFPLNNELRDAVDLEWIGGASQHSYLFAEPNGKVLRQTIEKALEKSGLQAGTPIRARYGLRVLVSEAKGPHAGVGSQARLTATYTIVERATGQEVFRQTVQTEGTSIFLGLNENDLKLAWDISAPLTAKVAVDGVLARIVERNEDTFNTGLSASEWSDFWESYRATAIVSILLGPSVAGLNFVNPNNYFPWASDGAAKATARREENIDALNDFQAVPEARNARKRSAQANYFASATNASGFLLALAKDQGVAPVPIFPCEGSPKTEALKTIAMMQGIGFTTDSCMIRRSRFSGGQ